MYLQFAIKKCAFVDQNSIPRRATQRRNLLSYFYAMLFLSPSHTKYTFITLALVSYPP